VYKQANVNYSDKGEKNYFLMSDELALIFAKKKPLNGNSRGKGLIICNFRRKFPRNPGRDRKWEDRYSHK
jgi:hypothetical protein